MSVQLDIPSLKLRAPSVTFQAPAAIARLRAAAKLPGNFLPGVEAIGAGYNIFAGYASAKSITSQLFDWSKAIKKPVPFKTDYSVPDLVDVQQQDAATYAKSAGSSIEQYQNSLSTSVKIDGGYNLFSGSISEEFNSTSLGIAENEFSRIQQTITLWSLVLRRDPARLRKLLFPNVREDLDSATTDAEIELLFNKYGSHFLAGIIMGGRAVLASSTNKVTVNRSETLEVVATQTYQALTGQLSAEERVRHAAAIASFEQSSDWSGFVTGGNSVDASKVFNGNVADFNAWTDSVGRSPDFVAFMTTNPLLGIWTLCADEMQTTKVQAYFANTWGPRMSREAALHADYIDALAIIYGDKSDIPAPPGYVKIPQDLNEGAKGKYIYLCYHATSATAHEKPCFVDIRFVSGNHPDIPAPPGYTKIDVDLNKDAGGDFIYLCYETAPYDAAAAIESVVIISGDDPDIPAPYGYIKIQQDLNAGAHGKYIYLCYMKTT